MQSIDNLCSKVQLFISCRKLKDVDFVGVSDPMVYAFIKEEERAQYFMFDKTEMIKDNLNPDFEKSFIVNYYFEKHQYLKFEVHDGNNMSGKTELIGTIETTVGTILGTKGQTYMADLKTPGSDKSNGKIIIKADSVRESNWEVTMKIAARGLPSTSSCLCANNNIFFEIYRGSPTDKNQFFKVYDSDPQVGTTDPGYQAFRLKGQQLCNSDKNIPIQIKFLNRLETQNSYLCSVNVTMNEMQERREFELKNQNTNQPAGRLVITQFQVTEKPTFVEYLRTGWQINLCVCIDYTASNGEYSQPGSLHYLANFNQYEQAISTVGSILEVYDNDRSFPVYGFGGVPRYMGQNSVNHCFALNGNPSNPEVLGTQAVMQLYRQTLSNIGLSGPTYFSHIITQMINIVKSRGNAPLYNIMLIITDGEIHDMAATKDLIVSASGLPLSIIIIGVGAEKFKLMKQLDSDKALLRDSAGRSASRDIVQFVKFKKYIAQGPQKLAEMVLKEIPDQFVSFMMNNGIKPVPIQFAQY